jgi:hypothetical protein
MNQSFGALGVRVESGQVRAAWSGQRLGPVFGALISLVPESRAHRVGGSLAATVALAPALGPLPLLGMLAKKDRATVYIQCPGGRLYQRTIKGNLAVRQAHGEAMQFQALAQAEPESALSPAERNLLDDIRRRVDARFAVRDSEERLDEDRGTAPPDIPAGDPVADVSRRPGEPG